MPTGPVPHGGNGSSATRSLNLQLRKIIKSRRHFPNDDAAIKLLWLAIRNIEDKRARERAKQKDPKAQRNVPGKLVEGARYLRWIECPTWASDSPFAGMARVRHRRMQIVLAGTVRDRSTGLGTSDRLAT